MGQKVIVTFIADEYEWSKILTALAADPATKKYLGEGGVRICPSCHGAVYAKVGEVKCPHPDCANIKPLV